nr:MAG TPA: Putative Holin-like Toxin (Hol-Tox) [Caudoviricetes sp.]
MLHPFRVLRKVVVIMSTYEELQIVLTTALLIVAILTYAHKK